MILQIHSASNGTLPSLSSFDLVFTDLSNSPGVWCLLHFTSWREVCFCFMSSSFTNFSSSSESSIPTSLVSWFCLVCFGLAPEGFCFVLVFPSGLVLCVFYCVSIYKLDIAADFLISFINSMQYKYLTFYCKK